MENENIATIHTDFNGVIDKWITFTAPFHNLTSQEQEVVSTLLKYYFVYKQHTNKESIVWKMVFDYETKQKLLNELGYKGYTLHNVLSRLRKKKILKGNKISKPYIPNIEVNTENYKLVFNFVIDKEDAG